jgi:hypothetical protein
MRTLFHALSRLLAAIAIGALPSLTVLVPATAQAAPAAVAEFVGTWRAAREGIVFHLRVHADGRVDFVSPNDGSTLTGRAMVGNLVGPSAFTGILPNGEVFSIGLVRGTPALSIGSTLVALESLPPQRLGIEDRPPAVASGSTGGAGAQTARPAAAPSTGASSLAGLRLSMAKGGNGYFTERSYDFCADGRVFTRWAENQLSQFGSGVSERTDQGTWRQDGGTVRLQLNRAGPVSFSVQRPEAGVVRLDGTGYAAEASRRCR